MFFAKGVRMLLGSFIFGRLMFSQSLGTNILFLIVAPLQFWTPDIPSDSVDSDCSKFVLFCL